MITSSDGFSLIASISWCASLLESFEASRFLIPLRLLSILTPEGHSSPPVSIVNLHQDHKLGFSPTSHHLLFTRTAAFRLQITENMVQNFRRTLAGEVQDSSSLVRVTLSSSSLLLPVACLLPTACCLLPPACCLLPPACFLLVARSAKTSVQINKVGA